MKRVFLGFVFLVVTCAGTLAQESDAAKPQILIALTQTDGQSGKIEIIQPPQVENLLKMQIANNRLKNGIPGYRIRIFSDSKQTARQKAEETRMNFIRSFPNMDAHLKHNPPNFQIFVGDFRTKNEALRELKRIEKVFPRAFIAPDFIDIYK